jgi:hypothetical protein
MSHAAGMSAGALVAGNTVVFKPSSESPALGYELYRAYTDAGMSAGVFTLLPIAVAAASAREFGSAAYGCQDTIAVAARVGVDYKKVVDLCLARDKRGMHLLFWLTANAGFDAASAEGHATVLGEVLRRVGDAFFAKCLRAEKPGVGKAVREMLLYDVGYERRELRKYPKTFPRGSR